MGYYLIAIGGTGAKVAESFIHLTAAGLLSPNEPLTILFVDVDESNGNVTKACALAKLYQSICNFQSGGRVGNSICEFARTQLCILKNGLLWSPFTNFRNQSGNADVSLDAYFGYNALNSKIQSLYNILFDQADRNSSLNVGFRGRTTIGSAVFASEINWADQSLWIEFKNRVMNDNNPKIFLVGSIFGGTGASGVPTIFKLMRQMFVDRRDVLIGGCLLLPYFKFDSSDFEQDVNGHYAQSETFSLTTVAALKYYHWLITENAFNALYFVGDPKPSMMTPPSLGAQNQKNDPHYVELLSSFYAVDFFTRDNFDEPCFLSGRQRIEGTNSDDIIINWSDLPYNGDRSQLRQKLGIHTELAFAYVSIYYPVFDGIKIGKIKEYRIPWFIDLFEKRNVELNDTTFKHLTDINTYFKDYLLWLGYILRPENKAALNLFHFNSFATEENQNGNRQINLRNEFQLKEFGRLVYLDREYNSKEVGSIWKVLCNYEVKDAQATGIGVFLNALFFSTKEHYLKSSRAKVNQ